MKSLSGGKASLGKGDTTQRKVKSSIQNPIISLVVIKTIVTNVANCSDYPGTRFMVGVGSVLKRKKKVDTGGGFPGLTITQGHHQERMLPITFLTEDRYESIW